MKLKSLKLANSIRIGSEYPAESFLSVEKGFQITLMPGSQIIQIVTPKGTVTYTTIYNVFYFDPLDAILEDAPTGKKARNAAETPALS